MRQTDASTRSKKSKGAKKPATKVEVLFKEVRSQRDETDQDINIASPNSNEVDAQNIAELINTREEAIAAKIASIIQPTRQVQA
jgi:hypothetical protein